MEARKLWIVVVSFVDGEGGKQSPKQTSRRGGRILPVRDDLAVDGEPYVVASASRKIRIINQIIIDYRLPQRSRQWVC